MADNGGMVNIGGKDVTQRRAQACGTILLGPAAFEVVRSGHCPKGDVLQTARIAAIQAAKSTATLIPMCHPIPIDAVSVDFELCPARTALAITATVYSTGRTGVEMEALTAAAVGCLTVYDMLKYTGKDMVIADVRLLAKSGGKSDDYQRQD